MAVRFERTIAGEVAYLSPRRDGPVLMWHRGERVWFAVNRPGGPITTVEAPERFGGTPRTPAEFRRFAIRFAESGAERRRGGEYRRAPARHELVPEHRRRQRAARAQKRDRQGRFT